jgi:protocatechuate 3,4-dioxygenase beta subunit
MSARRCLALAVSLLIPLAVTTSVGAQTAARQPACEWCGAVEAPASLGSFAALADPHESGARLVITGRVLQADGHTPAPNVLLYIYHADARGAYSRGGQTGNGLRHGHLRGWLRTGLRGKFRISTIRPAPYPGRAEPAHLHITVTPPGGTERWVDSIMFDDDPSLTPALRAQLPNAGGSGIVRVSRDAAGVQHAVRDIVLLVAP